MQNAAADIAGNLKEDGAGFGTAAVVACLNDKEDMVDNVVHNHMVAAEDKIAVDIVQVVVGALGDREIDVPVGVGVGVVCQNRV